MNSSLKVLSCDNVMWNLIIVARRSIDSMFNNQKRKKKRGKENRFSKNTACTRNCYTLVGITETDKEGNGVGNRGTVDYIGQLYNILLITITRIKL